MHRALVAGAVLVPAPDNLQPDPVACCQSCLANAACTAWVYCPVDGGCTADESRVLATAEAAANSSSGAARTAADAAHVPMPHTAGELWAPYHGCRLLSLPAFTLSKDSPQIVAKGGAVPFISGAGGPAAHCPACLPARLPLCCPVSSLPASLPAPLVVPPGFDFTLLHYPPARPPPPHPTHCPHMPAAPTPPCRHPSHNLPPHPARIQRAPRHGHRLRPGVQVCRVAAAAQLPTPGAGGGAWGVGPLCGGRVGGAGWVGGCRGLLLYACQRASHARGGAQYSSCGCRRTRRVVLHMQSLAECHPPCPALPCPTHTPRAGAGGDLRRRPGLQSLCLPAKWSGLSQRGGCAGRRAAALHLQPVRLPGP